MDAVLSDEQSRDSQPTLVDGMLTTDDGTSTAARDMMTSTDCKPTSTADDHNNVQDVSQRTSRLDPGVDQSTNNDPESTPSSNDFPVAPDGGWGWVVCIAAFLCMVILDGMMFSFGVLFLELLEYFGTGKGQTAMVGSALMGTHLLAGPITSALVNAWGVRTVSMAGSIIATASFACSILSPNITVLTIIYGFVGGIGVSMIYLPSILAVGFYFEKRRALVNGITHSGSGIGTFLYSPLTEYLLRRFGWKGTMLILSGVVLNCLAFSALFRPVDDRKRKRRNKSSTKVCTSTSPLNATKEEVESLSLLENDCNECDIETTDRQMLKVQQNSINNATHVKNFAQMIMHRENKGTPDFFRSVPAITVLSRSTPSSPLGQRHKMPEYTNRCQCNLASSLSDTTLICPRCDVTSSTATTARLRAQSHSKLPVHTSHDHTSHDHTSHDHSANHVPRNMKLMYKKDAFYSGSLLRIPEYQINQSASLYSLPQSVRPSSVKEGDEEFSMADTDSCRGGMCSKLRDVASMLRKMTGISLLNSPTFLLTMFSMVMWTTHSTVLTLLPDCAVLRGVSRDNAAFLLAIIGGANTAARILAGWVSDRPDVNCLHLNITSLILGGISCFAIAFTTSFTFLAIESAVFGLCMGTWTSLRPIILVDVLGLDNLTNAFGLVAMFQGAAFLVGPPIAGAYIEKVRSYTTPFIIAGGAFLLSAALCSLLCFGRRISCLSSTLRGTNDDETALSIDVKNEKNCHA